MMDWTACFTLEVGRTYLIRYVRLWEDQVRIGEFTFHGEVLPGNHAVVVMDPNDKTSIPGPIHILQIDRQAAAGEIRGHEG
jgi:hypothetical protein